MTQLHDIRLIAGLPELATATVIQPLDLRLRIALIQADSTAPQVDDPALPVGESTGVLFQGGTDVVRGVLP